MEKSLTKLGRAAQNRIVRYLETRIATGGDPRRFGEELTGNKKGLWRYRVDAYRILCHIQDEQVTVLVVEVGHRREVYH